MAAKFYYDATTATFDLGGDIFVAPNAAIRYMCDPMKDGASIGGGCCSHDLVGFALRARSHRDLREDV